MKTHKELHMKSQPKTQRLLDATGTTRLEWLSYRMQRMRAKQRSIDWQFNYTTWVQWWGTDIHNRGRCSGQLVMARKGDAGPYSPSNTEKITCNQNHSDSNYNRLK